MKKRLLFYEIFPKIEHKNAILVTGMRQVGKTTLMKQLFEAMGEEKKKLWFDFDNPLEVKVFEDEDYRAIYTRLQSMAGARQAERLYVWIDEIQNYPLVTKVIKYLLDHFGVKFFVTGSSQFYLKNLFPESLSGRKFLYELPPLSFRELLYFRDKLEADKAQLTDMDTVQAPIDLITYKEREVIYEEYLQYGGFPEVVVTPDSTLKQEILKNIVKSFFEKDVQLLSDYKDVRELRDLLLLLVPRVGSTIDVTRLSSELGVERAKVYGYLEFLQGTFVITLLPRFSRSVDRSVAGGRKVYFADNGLLTIVGSVNDGQRFENAIINQLRAYGSVSFYRRGSAEVDAILEKKLAFEVKLTGTISDVRRIQKLTRKLGLSRAQVISKRYVESPGVIQAQQL